MNYKQSKIVNCSMCRFFVAILGRKIGIFVFFIAAFPLVLLLASIRISWEFCETIITAVKMPFQYAWVEVEFFADVVENYFHLFGLFLKGEL